MTNARELPQLYDVEGLLAALDRLYPRMLSQIDRDPDSPTYGSCDRHFWQYRLNDFDSGVVQQTSLVLATLYHLAEAADLSGCRYLQASHRPYWAALAAAINRRNVRLFADRGCMDEYYPGENSYPATAFAGYATLKSALMLDQQEIIARPGLAAAVRKLLTRDSGGAANQDVASAAFLLLYARSRDWRTAEVRNKAERLIAGTDGSSSFLEYGGFDVGYATVSLNYLAYMDADGTHAATNGLFRLAHILADFVTPTGLLGGEFASRNTTYFLPYGFLAVARQSPQLAKRFTPLDMGAVLDKLDDRYLMHYVLPSLAMTALSLARNGAPGMSPVEETAAWRSAHHRCTGLYSGSNGRASIFVGLNKGGAFQIEVEGRTDIDCGYRVHRGGTAYATCVLDEAPDCQVSEGPNGVEIRVEAPFQRYRPLIASPNKSVTLRLVRFLGPALSTYFKQRMIKRPVVLPGVRLKRRLAIDYEAETVTVEDTIVGMATGDRLTASPASSLRTVPSAKFFQAGEEICFLDAAGQGDLVKPQSRKVFSLR